MALKLPEFDEQSVFDVVEKNFEQLGLKTYAIRMMYCGDHTLSKKDLIKHVGRSVEHANSMYCDIHISGILLVYDGYFVHVLEGSEDTVHRQLRFMFAREAAAAAGAAAAGAAAAGAAEPEREGLAALEPPDGADARWFRRTKCLMVYHSLSKLLLRGWRAVDARPPALVARLSAQAPFPEHMEQLKVCVDKIRRLCHLARDGDNLKFEGLSPADPKMTALPETALLDFLLQSPHVLDLRAVYRLHRAVPDCVFYHEEVWPPQTHYTPRHLYKLKIDDTFVEPLPAMPWEIVAKEQTDDEEHDDRDSGSSSD